MCAGHSWWCHSLSCAGSECAVLDGCTFVLGLIAWARPVSPGAAARMYAQPAPEQARLARRPLTEHHSPACSLPRSASCAAGECGECCWLGRPAGNTGKMHLDVC
jgi:hypothetical protein